MSKEQKNERDQSPRKERKCGTRTQGSKSGRWIQGGSIVRAVEVVFEEVHTGQGWRYECQMVMICPLLLLYIVQLVEPNGQCNRIGEGLLACQIFLLLQSLPASGQILCIAGAARTIPSLTALLAFVL